MLVLGWTIMGRKRSSYDYTMGFGVSARVAQKSTRLSVTPPHGISNKINQLITLLNLNCHPLSEERARLGAFKLVIIKHRRCLTQTLKSSSGMTGLLSGMTVGVLKGGGYVC